jgi:hypothetical protein
MAKSDPRKYEGPIAARYGDRLRQAASQVMTPTPEPTASGESPESRSFAAAVENVVELPSRQEGEAAGDSDRRPRPAADSGDNTCIRVLVSNAERDELDTLLNNLAKAVGARVKLANVLRASINQLLNAEEQIVQRAHKARHDFGARPANSNALALARFEDQLRDVVEAGLVDAARRSRPATPPG